MIDLGAELGDYSEPEKPSISDGYASGGILSKPFSIGKLADLQKQGFCTDMPSGYTIHCIPNYQLPTIDEPLVWRNNPLIAALDDAPEITYHRWMYGDPE